MVPLFAMVNFVVPEEDAVKRSPLFVLFNMNAALLPMPPETERTAGVLLLLPTYAPLLKSLLIIVFPLPLGVSVKFPFAPVLMVSAPESAILFAENV
jgi:hypothetical protein